MITKTGIHILANDKPKTRCGFDWLRYNLNIASRRFWDRKNRLVIAIDQSFVRNTKDKALDDCPFGPTPDPNKLQGLEVLGIGMINADSKECMMLRAVQALGVNGLSAHELTLNEWYLSYLWKYREELQTLTNIVVADAAFSTKPFVDGLQKVGFHLVSSLKNETALSYLYEGPATGMRGRPKKYDGEIDFSNLDLTKAKPIRINPAQGKAFEIAAWCPTLDRNIKLVVHYLHNGTRRLYFSTDEFMRGIDIYDFYRSRFLMESCFRATTQFSNIPDTGPIADDAMVLPHNASLSALNIMRLISDRAEPKHEGKQTANVSPRIRP